MPLEQSSENLIDSSISTKPNVVNTICDALIFFGSAAAGAGNGLLLINKLIPAFAAGGFILDSGLAMFSTTGSVIKNIFKISNSKLDNALLAANFLSIFPLPAAVTSLNLPPLNQKLFDVWSRFIPASGIATLNQITWFSETIASRCDDPEMPQPGLFRRIMRNLPPISAPLGVGLAIDGVYDMYLHSIEAAKNDEDKAIANQAFIPIIVGLTLIEAGVLGKSFIWSKEMINYFRSSENSTQEILNDESVEAATSTDIVTEPTVVVDIENDNDEELLVPVEISKCLLEIVKPVSNNESSEQYFI